MLAFDTALTARAEKEQAAEMAELQQIDKSLEALEQKKLSLAQSVHKVPQRIPAFTVLSLLLLCGLSLGAGVYYWYHTYFQPRGQVVPVVANITHPPFIPQTTMAFETTVATEPAPTAPSAEPPTEPPTKTITEPPPEPETEPPTPPRPLLDPRPQFIALWEAFGNEDIVGHIYIEGTALDVYVVQGQDNTHYRYHDIYGNPHPNGWVFMCHQVDVLMLDDFNTIIFGYEGSTMQQVLQQYFSYDFFLHHPVINFNTLYRNDQWEIFAFYVAPDNFPFAVVDLPWEYWGDTAAIFAMAALYNTRLDVTEYDQFLTLAAPASGGGGLYYVLQARLLRHITS